MPVVGDLICSQERVYTHELLAGPLVLTGFFLLVQWNWSSLTVFTLNVLRINQALVYNIYGSGYISLSAMLQGSRPVQMNTFEHRALSVSPACISVRTDSQLIIYM